MDNYEKKLILLHGDCLSEMKKLEDNSIDAVITDPPFGTTACKWDTVIPLEPMWEQLNRITKKNGNIVLFSSQPFTTSLIASNISNFKQEIIYSKPKGSNPFDANRRFMASHENICVFKPHNGSKQIYNPQMTPGKPYKNFSGGCKTSETLGNVQSRSDFKQESKSGMKGLRYPLSVQNHSIHCGSKSHPSEKPLSLMELLIKTYTNPEGTVLDFTMGSGSTGVACMNTGRNFIGIELNEKYYTLAKTNIMEVAQ